jgi:hypothetical protein
VKRSARKYWPNSSKAALPNTYSSAYSRSINGLQTPNRHAWGSTVVPKF